jgi:hypothetical protein
LTPCNHIDAVGHRWKLSAARSNAGDGPLFWHGLCPLALPMIEADQLQKAIEGLHRCSARLVQSLPVKETNKPRR